MYIKSVKVTNFRSLADMEVELERYTALVGLNDSGKSNLLRSLNLFFNGQTDSGHQLDFEKDFSQQGKVIGKKARQIEIEIEFSPPENYTDKSPVIWKKTYRSDSVLPFSEELYKKDGTAFSRGSRTEYWVRHVAFEYVPAIRGNTFFTILKRRLYAMLASTVAPKLTIASGTFLSNLRKEVKNIETESKRLLDLTTEFSLPGDLGELFEVLDFDAADAHSRTSLRYRGDGVQGRHIPVILKFLAEQRKINSSKGKPPAETIWGFEEPENNLELIKQIEVAEEFAEYSSSIQMLISTHSPAFYGAATTSKIAMRSLGKTSFASALPASSSIDQHLGLMPFIEPYLEKATQERDALIDSVKNLEASAMLKNKPALYVEGSTDAAIVKAAYKAIGRTPNFEIIFKEGLGGGANWVVGCCIARAAMTDLKEKTAALFDDDEAGQKGVADIKSRSQAIGRPNQIKCFSLGKDTGDDYIRRLKKSKIIIPVRIEEFCGAEAWQYAEQKGWLVPRGPKLMTDNVGFIKDTETTFSSVLDDLIDDDLELRRIVEFEVRDEKKVAFQKHFVRRLEDGEPVPLSLSTLLEKINVFFNAEAV